MVERGSSFSTNKIGFGGGCHWCTEAIFQSLIGVSKVEQGWISSKGDNESFSEGVIVHFDESIIELRTLIAIHLYTHSSTSNHSMRKKYRSAVYVFCEKQFELVEMAISNLRVEFEKPIVTQTLPFVSFKSNSENYQNYYLKNAGNQFCRNYIDPKFSILMQRFSKHFNQNNKMEREV